jgi:competence ComEA-like helix-hairpin-helix protein
VRISRDAHLALLVLLGLLACLVVARWEARHHPSTRTLREPPKVAASSQAEALRDGHGLDPNLASAAELELLPSVGPSLAQRIVTEREARGPFANAEALRRVKGIGAKTLEKLRPFLRFPSKPVEHAAESKLGLGHGAEAAVLPQKAGP